MIYGLQEAPKSVQCSDAAFLVARTNKQKN